jgi:virulence-associated protein VagC
MEADQVFGSESPHEMDEDEQLNATVAAGSSPRLPMALGNLGNGETAKLFRHGGSQAVRLPNNFRLPAVTDLNGTYQIYSAVMTITYDPATRRRTEVRPAQEIFVMLFRSPNRA